MNSLKDCTIKQYKDLQHILKSEQDDLNKYADVLAYIDGLDANDITVQYVKDNIGRLDFLNESKFQLKATFKLKGRRFDTILDARRIKFGKYIDVMNTIKVAPEQDQEMLIIDRMDKLMALLCVERTRFKKHLEYEELCELFNEHLTMDIVLPVSLFFSKVLTELTPLMLDYLAEVVEGMKGADSSQNIGGG